MELFLKAIRAALTDFWGKRNAPIPFSLLVVVTCFILLFLPKTVSTYPLGQGHNVLFMRQHNLSASTGGPWGGGGDTVNYSLSFDGPLSPLTKDRL